MQGSGAFAVREFAEEGAVEGAEVGGCWLGHCFEVEFMLFLWLVVLVVRMG